jgi:hypothetical protein
MGSIGGALIQVSSAQDFTLTGLRDSISGGDVSEPRMPLTVCQTRAGERDRNMATILEFRQGQKLSGSRRSANQSPAEIVFFPGVRYERWEDTPSAKPAKKRARRRDRINLND